MQARTVDLSRAGIALLLPHALRPGSICHISFALYIDGIPQQIAANAEVTNCVFLSVDVRVGLRFTSLDAQTQKLLAAFLR